MAKKQSSSDPQKGRQRRCRQVQAYLQSACVLYTHCSPRYCTHDSPFSCTVCKHQIRVGFRPNHQTVDHLMVCKVLEQRCQAWSVPLYISTIDFTKAFDRIKHSALWSSLENYGIGRSYVELLQRLYSQQEGTLLTDKRERRLSDQTRHGTRRSTIERDVQFSITIFSGG